MEGSSSGLSLMQIPLGARKQLDRTNFVFIFFFKKSLNDRTFASNVSANWRSIPLRLRIFFVAHFKRNGLRASQGHNSTMEDLCPTYATLISIPEEGREREEGK